MTNDDQQSRAIVPATLSIQQAAGVLNVSRRTVRDLLERKAIPSVHTGRHRRVDAAGLNDYLQKRDSDRSDVLSQLAKSDAEYLRA